MANHRARRWSMRAFIQGIEIEGTPQEIAALLKSIRPDGYRKIADPEFSQAPAVSDGDEEGITTEFAYRTLRRIPLSAYQKELLLALKGAYPDWILASTIQQKMSWSGTQLGGVLGGLGRRLTATKGYKPGFELWNWKLDEDEGEYSYRLPDAVLRALDRMEL
jgi:hypothetical protein